MFYLSLLGFQTLYLKCAAQYEKQIASKRLKFKVAKCGLLQYTLTKDLIISGRRATPALTLLECNHSGIRKNIVAPKENLYLFEYQYPI